MIGLTVAFAAGGALIGFWLAYVANAATSAGMAVLYGLMFAVVFAATRWTGGARRRRARAAAHLRSADRAGTAAPATQ